MIRKNLVLKCFPRKLSNGSDFALLDESIQFLLTYLLVTTFQESLIKAKLIEVDVLKHVIDLVIRLAK